MKYNTNITYRQVGDFKIPNLTLPPEEATITLSKWCMLHKNYLMKHKKVLFATLLANGKLYQHLADIDTQAQNMFDSLVEQMKATEGVTEQLKKKNKIKWICRMQSIGAKAHKITRRELIYVWC